MRLILDTPWAALLHSQWSSVLFMGLSQMAAGRVAADVQTARWCVCVLSIPFSHIMHIHMPHVFHSQLVPMFWDRSHAYSSDIYTCIFQIIKLCLPSPGRFMSSGEKRLAPMCWKEGKGLWCGGCSRFIAEEARRAWSNHYGKSTGVDWWMCAEAWFMYIVSFCLDSALVWELLNHSKLIFIVSVASESSYPFAGASLVGQAKQKMLDA